jgi:ankyrin repeat protein
MLKAEEGNLEEVRSILSSQSNLDINATNKHGYTALALATKGGFHNIVAALVLAGADVNQRNTVLLFSLFNSPSQDKLPYFLHAGITTRVL